MANPPKPRTRTGDGPDTCNGNPRGRGKEGLLILSLRQPEIGQWPRRSKPMPDSDSAAQIAPRCPFWRHTIKSE